MWLLYVDERGKHGLDNDHFVVAGIAVLMRIR
jgi:hypothetical protein